MRTQQLTDRLDAKDDENTQLRSELRATQTLRALDQQQLAALTSEYQQLHRKYQILQLTKQREALQDEAKAARVQETLAQHAQLLVARETCRQHHVDASIVLQSKIRSRFEQKRFQALKVHRTNAVVTLQSFARSHAARTRFRALQLADQIEKTRVCAVTTLQRFVRRQLRRQASALVCLAQQLSARILQKHARRLACVRVWRVQRQSVRVLQRWTRQWLASQRTNRTRTALIRLRDTLAMWRCKRHWKDVARSVRRLQRWWRSVARHLAVVAQLNAAAARIQRCCACWHATIRAAQEERELERLEAAVCIQGLCRGSQARRQAAEVRQRSAVEAQQVGPAAVIQTAWRKKRQIRTETTCRSIPRESSGALEAAREQSLRALGDGVEVTGLELTIAGDPTLGDECGAPRSSSENETSESANREASQHATKCTRVDRSAGINDNASGGTREWDARGGRELRDAPAASAKDDVTLKDVPVDHSDERGSRSVTVASNDSDDSDNDRNADANAKVEINDGNGCVADDDREDQDRGDEHEARGDERSTDISVAASVVAVLGVGFGGKDEECERELDALEAAQATEVAKALQCLVSTVCNPPQGKHDPANSVDDEEEPSETTAAKCVDSLEPASDDNEGEDVRSRGDTEPTRDEVVHKGASRDQSLMPVKESNKSNDGSEVGALELNPDHSPSGERLSTTASVVLSPNSHDSTEDAPTVQVTQAMDAMLNALEEDPELESASVSQDRSESFAPFKKPLDHGEGDIDGVRTSNGIGEDNVATGSFTFVSQQTPDTSMHSAASSCETPAMTDTTTSTPASCVTDVITDPSGRIVLPHETEAVARPFVRHDEDELEDSVSSAHELAPTLEPDAHRTETAVTNDRQTIEELGAVCAQSTGEPVSGSETNGSEGEQVSTVVSGAAAASADADTYQNSRSDSEIDNENDNDDRSSSVDSTDLIWDVDAITSLNDHTLATATTGSDLNSDFSVQKSSPPPRRRSRAHSRVNSERILADSRLMAGRSGETGTRD